MQERLPARTHPSFHQVPVVDETRGNHCLLIPVAAVAVVEAREGAELGFAEGEADLPGAACGEEVMRGDLAPSGREEKLLGGRNGKGSLWKHLGSVNALAGHLVRGPKRLPCGFKATMVQQEPLHFFLHKKSGLSLNPL